MSEKLCVFCKHFTWEKPWSGALSEVTWDSGGGATCDKGKYFDEAPIDTADFRELILKAQTCADYTPPSPTEAA